MNDRGEYIGRVCHYRECRPRRACLALHCGMVPHLNDDLEALRLSSDIIEAPPLTVWPTVERRCRLPADVEAFVRQLNAPSDERPGTDRSPPLNPENGHRTEPERAAQGRD